MDRSAAMETGAATSEVNAFLPQDASVRSWPKTRLLGAASLFAVLAAAATAAVTRPRMAGNRAGTGDMVAQYAIMGRLSQSHMGCENWHSILSGHALPNKTKAECMDLSCSNSARRQFDSQPLGCQRLYLQLVGTGMCFLFKEGCILLGFVCWHLYGKAE